MNNMKGFIFGFGISILGVCLYNQPCERVNNKQTAFNSHQINLFKEAKATPNTDFNIASNIKKETLFVASNDISFEKSSKEDTEETVIAFEPEDINGIEDEEILNINTDDIIPIEINNNPIKNAYITQDSIEEEKVAMLPLATDIGEEAVESEESSPWVIAKGSKFIDNKKLLEENNNIDVSTAISKNENFAKEDLSYEVATKIKRNIIFPIPDEILNDEDLTPTFIKDDKKATSHNEEKKPQVKQPTLIEKKQVEAINNNDKQSNIIDNISTWFNKPNTKEDKEETQNKKTKIAPPVYSSQESEPNKSTLSSEQKKQNLGDFYEALQKTKQEHNKRRITPSELKLSFNPGRAEISGQTLRWLKAFSEKSNNESCVIQVMLDASTSTELQRKRLNLLYTIFINNDVDLNKVDTVFSNVEPNTFIIRTINISKPQF